MPSLAISFDRSFYKVFLEVGLTQLVCEPTIITSNNLLDLILVSNTKIVGGVAISPPLQKGQYYPVVVDLYNDVNDDSIVSMYVFGIKVIMLR